MNRTLDHGQTYKAAALSYAQMGWPTFPICRATRKAHKSAKHSDGRTWGATTDPDEIREDRKRWPDANLGIATGRASGFFALDVDTALAHAVDGFAGLATLIRRHGSLPLTVESQTPTGGRHYYFAWPDGGEIRNSAGRVAPGIDVRGEGGMVIAPPSSKPGVGVYRWLNPPPLFEPEPAPDWLLDLCMKPEPVRLDPPTAPQRDPVDVIERQAERVRWSQPGTRNETLNRAAFICGMHGGAPESVIVDVLHGAARMAGLPDQETIATINSGLRAGAANGGNHG